MPRIDLAFFDLGYLDTLASQGTWIHRLDPRAKLVTSLVFIGTVASFGKYEISGLLPFFLFPIALVALGNLPVRYLIGKLLLAAPFAVLVGAFNPLLDHEVLFRLGPLGIYGGWVSFASILLRFTLTIGAALTLIATTGFPSVCMALERLGTPRVFVVQLLFLYRYLFVLSDEALRMMRARALRSFRGRGMGIRIFSHMVGQLLLRSIERARRIYLAMLCRGFDGEIRLVRPLGIGRSEAVFALGWSALFLMMRLYNLPQLLGRLFTGAVQ